MKSGIENLPISPYLNEICVNLKNSPTHALILTAETGAGKSTAVPVALLENLKGKILMLEPRRLAATAIADRVSSLLGEETGKTAGYRLHLESKISKETRIEVVTEAVLIRMLQSDPLLEKINVIVLDEFHERSAYSDLALAFLKETMQLRDDLFIVVMSATINCQSVAEYLGSSSNPASIMKIPGRLFPVEIEYKDNESVLKAVKSAVEALKLTNECSSISRNSKPVFSQSILVFLPGIYEIRKLKSELEIEDIPAEILVLHSSVSLSEQRKALSPSRDSKIRVILSSAIAETSLTVPDVAVVIDSGFSRTKKIDLNTGMEKLVTERESVFSADQRAGRAGRVKEGKCIRLWNKNEARILQNPPEILRADLSELVLECAAWGVTEKAKLSWLTEPSASAWENAKSLLQNLGCLDKENAKITEKGKAALSLGLSPRLACAALAAGTKNISAVTQFSEFRDSGENQKRLFEQDLSRRLSRAYQNLKIKEEEVKSKNPMLAGFPDRLAKLNSVEKDFAEYQFPSGRKAILKRENLRQKNLSSFSEWIIGVDVASSSSSGTTGRIREFETIAKDNVEKFLEEHSVSSSKTEVKLSERILTAKNCTKTSFGKIILSEKKETPEIEKSALAICNFIEENEIFKLPFDSQTANNFLNEKTKNFLLRAEFFITHSKSNEISDKNDKNSLAYKYLNLNKLTNDWLLSFISSPKIDSNTIYEGLYWFLDGNKIDEKVPLNITLPNGRKTKIIYTRIKSPSDSDLGTSLIQPSIEIIIQRIFGCFETPKILGEPILLKLLSPSSRPLQITDDLKNFWTATWPEICREMKGRYPKHNWDYRTAEKD